MVRVDDDLSLPSSAVADLVSRRHEALAEGGRPLGDVLKEIDTARWTYLARPRRT